MQKTNSIQEQELFMQRCLELALNGLGAVAPNPMVGSVIVHQGRVIGEGYHRKYGEAHAEVNAVKAVRDQHLLKESTLYVNLEPCSHIGKTPPCSDLIIEKQIPHVVIGTVDDNSLVAGRGIEKLKKAGVEVTVGVLPEACYHLNRRFFTYHKKKRPYIILKWAQTLDGFIDIERTPGTPVGVNWISTPLSRTLVHRWRSEEQGIMVGTNTVLADNPGLNLRYWKGQNPTRIVLDRYLRIPDDSAVYDDAAPTLIYNLNKKELMENVEYVQCTFDTENLEPVLSDLYQRGIASVFVEGGKGLHESMTRAGIWDEARVFIGNKKFGKGVKAPEILLEPVREEMLGVDKIRYYRQ